MNRLKGKIANIENHGGLTLVDISVEEFSMKSIVISDAADSFVSVNSEVELLFKETEVVISKEPNPTISLQNQLKCQIEHIDKGKLLSEIQMTFNSNTISSIITTNSVNRLELKEGDEVIAMIKTNEIMITPC